MLNRRFICYILFIEQINFDFRLIHVLFSIGHSLAQ
jgi:hypothetical protein